MMSVARVAHPVVSRTLAIGAALGGIAAGLVLVVAELVGYMVQVAVFDRGRLVRSLRYLTRSISTMLAVTRRTIRQNLDISLYLNLANTLGLALAWGQVVLIARFFSVSETGQYSMAMGLATLPIQVFSLATA